MNCQRCGYALHESASTCPNCATRIERNYLASPQAGAAVAPAASGTPRELQSLMRRYTNAYQVARFTVGAGGLLKTVGVILGLVIGLGAVIISGQTRGEQQIILLVLGGIIATFVGSLIFLLGVLVSAQGEVLKAILDGAVNNSPFLTNEHRAKIMSL